MGAIIKPMRHNRGRLLPAPCQAARVPAARGRLADGLKRLSGRTPACRGHLIHHHVTGPGTTSPRA